ncbi:MAG: hypothetical protein WB973_08910 [Thermoanaerobaculia bacterium]
MIRKQVYIEPRQDRMLKKRASQRGVTEAQLIREALDHVNVRPVTSRRTVDAEAAREAIAFMRSLAHGSGTPKRRASEKGLGAVRGWLPDDDPFFAAVEEIVSKRETHRPRTLPKPRKRSKR